MNRVSSRRQWFCKIGACLACALVALTSCDRPEGGKLPFKGKPEKRLRIFIAADTLADPMRNYQVTLLERFVRTRAGVDLLIFDAVGDKAIQAAQLKKMAAEGVDCLMVFPADAAAVETALRPIKEAGALVVVLGAEVSAEACTTSIFTNERKLGQLAGDFVVSALKKKAEDEGSPTVKGRVVQLTGAEDNLITKERSAGFMEALKAAPEVVLVHDAPAGGNEKEAAERIREALKLQKTFDVIYAQNDLMARGAGAAIKEADVAVREAMLIIGTDGATGKGGGIEMLRQGDMEATIYVPPLVDQAWQLVKQALDDPAFKTKIEKTYRLKPFVITLESVEKMLHQGLPAPELESF